MGVAWKMHVLPWFDVKLKGTILGMWFVFLQSTLFGVRLKGNYLCKVSSDL